MEEEDVEVQFLKDLWMAYPMAKLGCSFSSLLTVSST